MANPVLLAAGLLVSGGDDRAPDLKVVASSEAPAPVSSSLVQVPLTASARLAADGEDGPGWRPLPGDEAWLRVDLLGPRGLPPCTPVAEWEWAGAAPEWTEEWSRGGVVWHADWSSGDRFVRAVLPAESASHAELERVGVRFERCPQLGGAFALEAEATAAGVVLDWEDVGWPGVWSYDVTRAIGDGEPQPVADAVLGPPFVDRAPLAGEQVAYLVRAFGPDGNGGSAATVEVEPSTVASPFSSSGLVEGFYGPLWPAPTRRAVARRLATSGLDTWVYAPKNDRYHRDDWRLPYPDGLLEDRLPTGVPGLRVLFGIAPGLDFGAPGDDATLEAKCRQALGAGADGIVLLFDDVPTGDLASAGAAHAAAGRRLADALGEGVPLWFVPSVYSGQARRLPPDRRAYLEAMAGLPDRVPIAWTGATTVPEAISGEEIRAVSDQAGPPVGDNYPVNDGFMARSVWLGPLRGRGDDLPTAASAYLANPGLQPQLSARVIAGPVAAWAASPADYLPERQPPRLPAELASLEAELSAHELVWHDLTEPALATALADWEAVGRPLFGEPAVVLARHLARLVRLPEVLDAVPLTGGLYSELLPLVRSAAALGEAGLRALAMGEAETPDGWWLVAPGPAETLVERVQAAGRGAVPGRFESVGLAAMRTGEILSWRPALEADGWWLEGPTGAALDAEAGRLTWQPTAPGRYGLVMGTTGPGRVSTLLVEVVVVPRDEEPPAPEGPATGGCACGS